MVIVTLEGTTLKAANLGDSGFRVIRSGKVVFASPAQEHYFNCPYQLGYPSLSEDVDLASEAQEFEIVMQPGDLVIVGSDGLFDNVFDEDIASVANEAVAMVAGAGAFSAAMAASKALANFARKNAEDPMCDSPYALELTKEKTGVAEAAKVKGPFRLFNSFASSAASAMTGRKLGGKLDDITVIVGAIVATDAAQQDIAAAERLSQQMQKEAETIKKRAAGEEAKTLRSVHLRKQMDAALQEKVAQQEAAMKAEARRPPEFSTSMIGNMDASTIRRLLEERGLPTSGKIERLRERLGNVRAE
jgi:protein phosphatase PTC7